MLKEIGGSDSPPKIAETQFSLRVLGRNRDVVKSEQKSIVASPRIIAAMSKRGTYGYDDLIDLCHARHFARRGKLGLFSLACMEDSGSSATDAGAREARALSQVRRRLPVAA